jgi:cytochrome c oxidase subunit 4
MANETPSDSKLETAAPASTNGESASKQAVVKGDDGHAHDSHAHDSHAHGAHGHGHGAAHADHGLAHTTPVPMLIGILAILMILTIVTVLVTKIDLGGQMNLVVAMAIATVKAGLVVMFFMHLVWDTKFNLILFLTSVLFLILFLSVSTSDRGEYQPSIDQFQQSSATP